MQWRALGSGVLVMVGCAANSELAMRVETEQAIARLEFQERTTEEAVHVVGVPIGTSTQVVKLRAGVWCLVEYVVALGDFGRSWRPGSPICAQVGQGQRVDFGTLVLDEAGLRHSGGSARAATQPADGSPPPGPTPDTDYTPAADGNPQSVSMARIEAAMRRAELEIRRCMSEAGLATGTKINVVVRIEGATGRMTDVGVAPPFGTSELVDCTRAALMQVEFPTFADSKLDFAYPVVL
jgi:hypothetical protein